MSIPKLTSSDAMDRYLSAQGLVGFADHNDDGFDDDGVIDECILYASGFLLSPLVARYPVASMASAIMIPELATVIACRTLCTRRGNPIPESLEMRYQEIVKKDGLLDQIASGKLMLIDGNGNQVPGRGGYYPVHSNLQVDRRFTQEQIRVQQGSSSNFTSQAERDLTLRYNSGY